MKLLESLLETIPKNPISVQKVIIGAHWTLVSSRCCGLGSTLVSENVQGNSWVRDVGYLQQKSAQELAQWVLSDNLLEASIGIAAINSLLEIKESQIETLNAAEVIARESENKNLVIIGHFPIRGANEIHCKELLGN